MLTLISKWIPRLVVFVLGFVVALYLSILIGFQVSKFKALSDLKAASEVISTERGDVEVHIIGDLSSSKPVVLVTHGSAGGYDQGVLMVETVYDDNFTYIVPSRPGYLRTPLDSGRTPAEQADAFAALLDELQVDQVTVFGGSGGGPSALEFARRHSDRTISLVLYAPVSQTLDWAAAGLPPPSSLEMATDTMFGIGFLEWAYTRPLIWFPEKMDMLAEVYVDSWPRIIDDKQKTARFSGTVFTSLWRFPQNMRSEGYRNDVMQHGDLDLGSFASLDVPTLLVHGTADSSVPFASSEALSQEIPEVETYWIENGDHISLYARVEELAPLMNDFMQAHTTLAGIDNDGS